MPRPKAEAIVNRNFKHCKIHLACAEQLFAKMQDRYEQLRLSDESKKKGP